MSLKELLLPATWVRIVHIIMVEFSKLVISALIEFYIECLTIVLTASDQICHRKSSKVFRTVDTKRLEAILAGDSKSEGKWISLTVLTDLKISACFIVVGANRGKNSGDIVDSHGAHG